jgi:hypothetical protein
MSDGTVAVPTRQICVESVKKAALCIAAVTGIGAALPYSYDFAFHAVTYLGFAVALAEGTLSAVGDMTGDHDYALRKITEAVETLGASLALLVARVTYLTII